MSYNQTGTFLDRILAQKVIENAEVQKYISMSEMVAYVNDMLPEDPPRDFMGALHRDTVALIAEVKKASPSKGVLIENFDPVDIGETYAENGAAAISVLTDKQFFQGDLKYLYDVRNAVEVPVLRKDFVIDPYQVYAGRASGADAILLIVAALADSQMTELHELIHELGMAALVEVHDEAELERALKIGASLIGVNNRNLKTFDVDLEITTRIARLVPENVTLVAESGISTTADVQRMGQSGAHAVLVGEALVKAGVGAMAETVKAFSSQRR
ncbi:MAG TPA: indole-3-glycerol phosphate synthase TrpC [Phototrophicaceae bacterium]|jgi:indole-3-glycerol phosphate synthase|nr:indole-3-glycerol phosphate synthase TrpC [Phototrophicaceae bacterium]